MTKCILCYSHIIPALENWSDHSKSKDENSSCYKHGKECSLLGKMPPLMKIELRNEKEIVQVENEQIEKVANKKETTLRSNKISKRKKKCIVM